MRDSVSTKEIQNIARYDLTEICNQVLSSPKITIGIICINNIIELATIAKYRTASNKKWNFDFCGLSSLFFFVLLLDLDRFVFAEEVPSVFFFLRDDLPDFPDLLD
mmetsp:Transcript_731/g.1203  ORF Transcript_731/g.1203 Transcript_731/m.1203 type:complete len:106 (-) Transcript_731:192-509(-)